jgi:hypothetical protein
MADQTHNGGGDAAPGLDHRSPRKTAMERNDAKNFDEGPPYDVTHGHPITKEIPSQDYKAMAIKPASDTKPVSDLSSPFTIKGA